MKKSPNSPLNWVFLRNFFWIIKNNYSPVQVSFWIGDHVFNYENINDFKTFYKPIRIFDKHRRILLFHNFAVFCLHLDYWNLFIDFRKSAFAPFKEEVLVSGRVWTDHDEIKSIPEIEFQSWLAAQGAVFEFLKVQVSQISKNILKIA